MSNLLQKHLEEACNKQENLKLLKSQWDFDYKLIPKALQSVGQLFPHYSRHDQSHSDQILINIERILGDRVSLLSATDTWMLLEAAYWHDLGMVVPNKSLEEALEDTAFQSYLLQVAHDPGNELQKFATFFLKSFDLTQCFTGADHPLDAVIKFRLLMAEWFRRKHPARSEKAMNDPWNELGLSSPRTELIPSRLFRILGRVCSLHGASFSEILSDLPHKEVGMANDDCHPRFVACLLRLGDLLDMDDNRFCPVMQRIAGDNRPALSKAHEDKHSSIRHFRLDNQRIEISAVCESIDGYVEQWRWLDMLRDEMQNQMARWQDIAPSVELGLLPMLGDIKVDIAGRALIAESGKRPEFTLNANRVMDLLKGDNLYDRFDTFRELLQNAVDASLLRIWECDRPAIEQMISQGKSGDFSYEIFNKYPVITRLERISDNEKDYGDDKIYWRLTISDQGVGIDRSDLLYMTKVAGSGNNIRRMSLINGMPEWLQPSGTFGIGLQSAFMWSEKIVMKTKSLYSQEALNIILHSPTGAKKGLVEVEGVDDYLRPIGTSLIIEVATDRKSNSFSISNDKKQTLYYSAIVNCDWLLDQELPLDAYRLIDEVALFSKNSPVSVECFFESEHVGLSSSIDTTSNLDFFNDTNTRFDVDLGNKAIVRDNSIYYRGQKVKEDKGIWHYPFFNYKIDLYSGKASAWLTFNRNSLSFKGKKAVQKVIEENIRLWVAKNLEDILKEDSTFQKTGQSHPKVILSAFAKIKSWSTREEKAVFDFWESISNRMAEFWKDFPCDVIETGKSPEENKDQKYVAAELLKVGILITNYSSQSHRSDIVDYGIPEKKIVFSHDLAPLLINDWMKDTANCLSFKIVEPKCSSLMVFPFVVAELALRNNNCGRFNIADDVLVKLVERKLGRLEWSTRIMLPIELFPEGIKAELLEVRNDVEIFGVDYLIDLIPYPTEHLIIPYLIKPHANVRASLESLDKFISWVHSRLKNPVDIETTRNTVNAVINWFDELMKSSAIWESFINPLKNIP